MTESQIILYTTPDGDIKVNTILQKEATLSKMETVQNVNITTGTCSGGFI